MTTHHPVKAPKKLIEVALPLDAINTASAAEKRNPFLVGHPRNLHQWWARRPLAAARAVIFSQMVNDPSWKWEMEHPGEIPSNNLKASWAASRRRLFAILEELVAWDNTTNEVVLEKARTEIRRSWCETCEINNDHPDAIELFNADRLPAFHDPFAGGGALPLEGQRLGLEVHASDLNPVAVLINKAMIEIPPKFAGRPPLNPAARGRSHTELIERSWKGSQGLADDVRYYGQWMRDEAEKRIGYLYTPITITSEMAVARQDLKSLLGQRLPVIAWIWARIVKSPNPAFRHIDVPLVSTFILSSKKGRQSYVHPVLEPDGYHFTIRIGEPPDQAKAGTTAGKRAAFRCLMSGVPIDYEYIRSEGKAGRIGQRLMAVVVAPPRSRVYLEPTADIEETAHEARPVGLPSGELPKKALGFRIQEYGMTRWSELFTPRQSLSLTTLSNLTTDLRERIRKDARLAGLQDSGRRLNDGGDDVSAYADALATIMALCIDKFADYNNTICTWNPTNQNIGHLFTKQSIQMGWDFPEISPLCGGLSFDSVCAGVAKAIKTLPASVPATAAQQDCATLDTAHQWSVISTDPPYYDNIGYADLSDFFYVWLRRSLKSVYPQLFATVSTPKTEELIASPSRHGSKGNAEAFFLSGMEMAMQRLSNLTHPTFPVTIYYAFKQVETKGGGTVSTGWETFLEAVIKAGFTLTGTWPMRTEREARAVGLGTNALASSILLVCRPRRAQAITVSRRAFQRELNRVLPEALDEMTKGAGDGRAPVAPVDLSQAIIGPGMAVFSKYSAVLEADGTPMSIRTALQLINRFLAEDDFDHDTQFCLQWFEQHGWKNDKFGDADTLARAKGTSVEGVKQAGVLLADAGVVRLLKWADYPAGWDPTTDPRLSVWEVLHHIIRVFKTEGESAAGVVLASVQGKAEATRQLAYRLYTLCERAGWAEDARAYNEIITSWSAIESAAAATPAPQQSTLFD